MNALDYMTIDAIAEATEEDIKRKEIKSSHSKKKYRFSNSNSLPYVPLTTEQRLEQLESNTKNEITKAKEYKENAIKSRQSYSSTKFFAGLAFVFSLIPIFVLYGSMTDEKYATVGAISGIILLVMWGLVIFDGICNSNWLKREIPKIIEERERKVAEINKEYEEKKAEILNNPS